MPSLNLENEEIVLAEEMKILGVVITPDMKWSANTANMLERAYKRVWILRRLKSLGTGTPELIDVYIKQIRSILEFAVPVWNSSLTLADRANIERVQKSALHVMLGDKYATYPNALKQTELTSLEERRSILCSKFAYKAVRHHKHSNWFSLNSNVTKTRQVQPKFRPVISKTLRFEKSPISYLTDLLNTKFHKQKVKL